jgi:hypothetical protein
MIGKMLKNRRQGIAKKLVGSEAEERNRQFGHLCTLAHCLTGNDRRRHPAQGLPSHSMISKMASTKFVQNAILQKRHAPLQWVSVDDNFAKYVRFHRDCSQNALQERLLPFALVWQFAVVGLISYGRIFLHRIGIQ